MGKVVRAIIGVGLVIAGVVSEIIAPGNPWGFKVALLGGTMVLGALLQPKTPATTTNTSTQARLSKQLDPEAFRKIVFGKTALATDLRYWEASENNANYDEVIALASHKIQSVGNLYLEDLLISFTAVAGGDVTNQQTATGANYPGNFTRYYKLQGVSASGIPLGLSGKWTSAAAMTGIAYAVYHYNYSADNFPNGIPSRYTQEGEGAMVYDPRRDSTQGGSGSHRANDPATWEYAPTDSNSVPIGRNNALQLMTYLLGIYIKNQQTSAWVLIGGRAVDPNDFDYANWISAANICEAQHYYTDCILSTGDTHDTNESILKLGSSGQLSDTGGVFSYYPAYNDTANVIAAFGDDDIISDFEWTPSYSMADQFNEVGGNYIEPASPSLYQAISYPVVSDPTYYAADGFKRRKTLAFQCVQDVSLAQKLARIYLNKSRFQGTFTATFNLRALMVINYGLITLSLSEFGWVNKLFRVTSYTLNPNSGGIDMILQEENASVYAGGTVIVPAPPSAGVGIKGNVTFDPTGVSATPFIRTTEIGRKFAALDVVWSAPSGPISSINVRIKASDDTYYTTYSIAKSQTQWRTPNLQPATSYDVGVQFISRYGKAGNWVNYTQITSALDDTQRFIARQTWEFENSANGWTGVNATIATGSQRITWTPTGTIPYLVSPILNIPGAQNPRVKIRFTPLSTVQFWAGNLQYSTAGHGFSTSFYRHLGNWGLTVGEWTELEFAMDNLSVGGSDWITNTITGLRFELVSDVPTAFIIDWISIGTDGTADVTKENKSAGNLINALNGSTAKLPSDYRNI